MTIDPAYLHWPGVVLGCLIYLYIICMVIDRNYGTELSGILYEVAWVFVLRRIVRFAVGLVIVVLAGGTLIMAGAVFVEPWRSLAWVLPAIPVLRIAVWVFWLLEDGADVAKWGRDSRADQQNIHGWDRFWLWCFSWGRYEGLLTEKEKAYWRDQRKREANSTVNPLG